MNPNLLPPYLQVHLSMLKVWLDAQHDNNNYHQGSFSKTIPTNNKKGYKCDSDFLRMHGFRLICFISLVK